MLTAQTNIDVDIPGQSHNDISGLIVDDYIGIDISACSSISFSVSYEFSLPWEGSGNMEISDDCSGCSGDPNNPIAGGCNNCWDFMWMQFFIDGSEVDMELIGESGTTDLEQSGTYTSPIFCVDGAADAEITITNQNWASDETNAFSNVIIICYEGVPEIMTNDPICGNGDLELDGSAEDETVVTSWEWTNDGAGAIDDDTAQNTFSVGAEDGEEYVLTTTDINGCESSTATVVSVSAAIDAAIGGGGDLCEDSCTDIDSDVFFLISGGTEPYTVNLTVNGIPIPALGIDIDETVRVCNDSDAILPDINFGSDPVEIIIPSGFFPIDIELVSVTDDTGCAANIDPANNSINLDVLDSPEISEPNPPQFCADSNDEIDLTVMDEEITDGDNNLTVIWFFDQDLDDQIPDPENYDISNGNTVYAIVEDGNCPSEAIQVDLEIFITPLIVITTDIVDCAFPYELPDIEDVADVENTNNPVYYLDQNLTNGPFTSGSFIDPTGIAELFIYDANGPCETIVPINFNVSIPPEIIFPQESLDGCGSLILPSGEFDGTVVSYEYNTEVDGSGMSFDDGDEIFEMDNIQVLYLIAYGENDCVAIEEIEINLDNLVEYEAPLPPFSCGDVILPAITPNTGDVAYYTQSGATGTMYLPGDTLFAMQGMSYTQILYITDPEFDQDCASEVIVSFDVNDAPDITMPSDTLVCDFYILDSLDGNYSMMASFATDTFLALETMLNVGDTIFDSDIIFVIDTIGDCTFLDSFAIDIPLPPDTGQDGEIRICEGYDLMIFDFMQLAGEPDTTGSWNVPFIPDFVFGDSTAVDLSLAPFGEYEFLYVIEDTCQLYTTVVTLFVSEPPSAGNDMLIELCSSTPDLNFFSEIGAMDTSGDWMQTSGPETVDISSPDQVQMQGRIPGTYSFDYLLSPSGAGLCYDQTSTLEIILNEGANAGSDNDVSVCVNEIVEVADLISVDANQGGVLEPNGFLLSGTQWNTAGFMTNQSYTIDYIVTSANPQCPGDTATYTIFLTDDITAGSPFTPARVCEGETINLNDFITDESPGGMFFNQDNPGIQVSTDQTISQTSTFQYLVEGTGGCASDSIEFDIEMLPAPSFSLDLSSNEVCTIDELCTELTITSQGEVQYGIDILQAGSGATATLNNTVNGSFTMTLCWEGTFNTYTSGADTLYLGNGFDVYEIIPVLIRNNATACELDPATLPILMLDFFPAYSISVDTMLCEGESLAYNGEFYLESEQLILTDANGCDSIIDINIANFPISEEDISALLCEGDSIEIGGVNYFSNTNTTIVLPTASANGCDSLINIDLVFESTIFGSEEFILCPDDNIVIEGVTFDQNNPSGMVDIQEGSANGCDSILNVSLTFLDHPVNMIDDALCEDQMLIVGSDIYDINNPQGMTNLMGMASNGCDSIVEVNLSFIPAQENNINMTFCDGESIKVNNVTYDADNPSGTEVITNGAVNGCDSIINIDLSFETPSAMVSGSTICPDEMTGLITIDNLVSLESPVQVIVNNTVSGTYQTAPITVTGTTGINTVSIVAGNCTFLAEAEISQVDTSNLSVNAVSSGPNTYTLTLNTGFIPEQIVWSPAATLDCTDCNQVNANVDSDVQVTVIVTHPSGCEFEESIFLKYSEIVRIYFPNIFDITDFSNNTFYIGSNDNDLLVSEMRIYDRWGNLLFEDENIPVNDPDRGWNGTRNNQFVEQGVYVYVITYINAQGDIETIAGDITLLR